MELLGVVGEYAAELRVYQLHFGVKPCRYPAEEAWALRPADAEAGGRLDCTHLRVFSVDNASTRDIDDALSLELAAGVADACPADDARATSEWAAGVSGTLGVHVADVASRVPCDSPLFAWAFGRASSCYHGGVDGEGPGGSVPMLPPELAHGELSLNEGARRNALSVFLRIDGGAVVECWHAQTSLINNNATTYAAFGQDATPYGRAARALLRRLSGEHEPEELVAWTMIKYNSYLGALLSSRGDAGGIPAGAGLLRVQPVANEAATYGAARGAADARTHAGLALVDYAHCSSPIRRYADLHNQHVLASTLGAGGVLDATRLAVLNERAAQVSHYHAMTSAMELAHACRKEPKTFACRVETDEDGTALRVYTERGRVKVPLRDSYFAEPLAAHFAGAAGDVKVQLYGVLKNGRTQLRVRVQEVAAVALNLRSPLAAAATDAPAAAATDAPAMAAPPGLTGRGGRGRGGRGGRGRGSAAAATRAPVPVAPRGTFTCYGCGAELQTEYKFMAGYVEPERYAEKKLHKQLRETLCARCRSLAHGEILPAVAEGRLKEAGGASFATPDELRAQLTHLRERTALVVLLADLTDVSATLMPRVRDLVGGNPLLLVGTKLDLLPSGTSADAVHRWLEEYAAARLNVVGVRLLSSRTGAGVRAAARTIVAERGGRDVYLVGAANVGKSKFLAALIDELAAGGGGRPEKRLPLASSTPGTTLRVIPFDVFSGGSKLYDTPGVHLAHRMPAQLTPAELAAVAPRRAIRPFTPAEPAVAGTSYFLGGLARIDVVAAPPSMRLSFCAFGLRVHTVPTAEAEAAHAANAGAEWTPPLDRDSAAELGALTLRRTVELELTPMAQAADLAISGLGWVSVGALASLRRGDGALKATLDVWLPKGVELFVRPPMPIAGLPTAQAEVDV